MSAGPPVVLVHGWGGSFDHTWRPLGWDRALRDAGRAAIGVDLLGHGRSARPHDPAAYAGLRDHALAQFAEEERVDAVGFSLGAKMLLELASRQPQRFRRLVLLGIGANAFRPEAAEAVVKGLQSGLSADVPIPARPFVAYGFHSGNDPQALAACLQRPPSELEAADLRTIDSPALVLTGEDDDFIVSPQPLIDALAHVEACEIAGVDHLSTPYSQEAQMHALRFLATGPSV